MLNSVPQHPLSLGDISVRAICLVVLRTNVRWRRLADVEFALQRELREWPGLPHWVRSAIGEGVNEALKELQRWDEKHAYIFPDTPGAALSTTTTTTLHQQRSTTEPPSRRREHLRLFYSHVVWRPHRYHIDDLATARQIITGPAADWPLLQFQFACCYAMDDVLSSKGETPSSRFDKLRLRTFRCRGLDDHPVYNFWLRVLEDKEEWRRLYSRTDRILVDQHLLQALLFAMHHGFYELLRRLWADLTEAQQEAVGFLGWKKVCYSAEHRELTHFLCHRLCEINPMGMARLTWDSFYDKVHKALGLDGASSKDGEHPPEEQRDSFRKLESLLENWCERLRSAMLSRENYRAVTDAFFYKRAEAFSLFLDHMSGEELGKAREHVDRIYDRNRECWEKQSPAGRRFEAAAGRKTGVLRTNRHGEMRKMMVQRQATA